MKVVFVGEAVSGFGGIETVIRTLVRCFREDPRPVDCAIFFFCRDERMDKGWLAGIDTGYSHSRNRIAFLRNRTHVRRFARYLREQRPDVVISIDPIACLLAKRARQRAGLTFPLFSWVHFSLEHKKHADCIVHADYHLAISTGIKAQIAARGVDPQRIFTVFNPVERQAHTIPRPQPGEECVFLYVGRMKFEGQKRIKDLLDALSQVTGEWRLHVVGDGSDMERCQAYGRELGIDDRIVWHGWQADPWQYVRERIGAVSALLLTSAFEGFGMSLVEAMSYGIYCISSDCPWGPADIVREGVNGKLYALLDVQELRVQAQQVIGEGLSVDQQQIKRSIETFYTDGYYQRMREVLLPRAGTE
jgi:UDP-D-galactose:(glucosyl)LPS alpha-1,6-D-galactosyltransferase